MSNKRSASQAGFNENVVIGLKTEIARQSSKRQSAEEAKDFYLKLAMSQSVKYWKAIFEDTEEEELAKKVWKFLDKMNSQRMPLYIPVDNSKDCGIYTSIKNYTNKQNKTHAAHFTVNNHYLGSVKKLGTKPISYSGNIPVTPNYFAVDLSRLDHVKGDMYDTFQLLFVPIKKFEESRYAESNSESDMSSLEESECSSLEESESSSVEESECSSVEESESENDY